MMSTDLTYSLKMSDFLMIPYRSLQIAPHILDCILQDADSISGTGIC